MKIKVSNTKLSVRRDLVDEGFSAEQAEKVVYCLQKLGFTVEVLDETENENS